MSDLKLNIVNENTGESILRAVVLAVLSEMGVTGVSQEEIENAVSSYLANHPIEGITENEVSQIVADYISNHPTGVDTEEVNTIIADYLTNHPVSGVNSEEVNALITAYMTAHPIEGLTESQVQTIVANYISAHPTESIDTSTIESIVDDYVANMDITEELKKEINAYGNINLIQLKDEVKNRNCGVITIANNIVTIHRTASGFLQSGLFTGVLNGKYRLSGCPTGGSTDGYYINVSKEVNGEFKTVIKEMGDGVTLDCKGENYKLEILDKNSTIDGTLIYTPKLELLELSDGTMSNVALTGKIGNLNTDRIEVVRERTIYDINHMKIITNVGRLNNGVYTLIAPQTGNKWDEYMVYDNDLKASNGIATLKVHIAEISGEWKFYSIFKNKSNEDVYLHNDIPNALLSQTGDFTYAIDLNYLAVYKGYNGQGVNLVIVNKNNSSNNNTYQIVIDEYSVVTEGISTNGETLTDVIKNLTTGTGNSQTNENRLYAPNGDSYVLQIDNSGALKAIPQIPSNILYIGNSLLLGFGNHGMASSNVSGDYYYKINSWIEAQGKQLTTDRLSGTGFESCTTNAEVETWLTETLAPQMNNNRELVIVQLGDNVNNATRLLEFDESCGMLLSYIREHCPSARVAWVGLWYSSDARLAIVRKACRAYGCTFVDIHDLSESETYRNHVGATYIDGNGNEQTITETGVSTHPSDVGFTEIAKRVVEQLFDGEYTEE